MANKNKLARGVRAAVPTKFITHLYATAVYRNTLSIVVDTEYFLLSECELIPSEGYLMDHLCPVQSI